jgi:hypothetical protein
MAIKTDMNKAKQKSVEVTKKAAERAKFGKRTLFWKPKVGSNILRIMPPWTAEGPNQKQWWREIYVHYGVTAPGSTDDNNAFTVPCPKYSEDAWYALGLPPNEDRECPICDYVAKLKEAGDPASIALASDTKAKLGFMMNIIDLNDPIFTTADVEEQRLKTTNEQNLPAVGSPKFQVYGFGSMIMQGLLDFYQDNVDLADIEKGHNIKLEREGLDRNTKYRPRPDINPTPARLGIRDTSPLLKDADLSAIYNLDETRPFMTNDQMEKIIAGGTREEVFALNKAPAVAQLPAASSAPVEEAVEEENEAPEAPKPAPVAKPAPKAKTPPPKKIEAVEEDIVDAVEEEEEKPEWIPPLDAEGYIDYENISDEQLEDQANAEKVDTHGYSVYVECFGKARERDPNSEGCAENCSLFERCGKRLEFLDDQIAKKAAKKGPGKPKAAPKSAPVAESAPVVTSKLSLEDEMKAALAGGK